MSNFTVDDIAKRSGLSKDNILDLINTYNLSNSTDRSMLVSKLAILSKVCDDTIIKVIYDHNSRKNLIEKFIKKPTETPIEKTVEVIIKQPTEVDVEFSKVLKTLDKFQKKAIEYKHTDPKFDYMYHTTKCIKVIEKHQDKEFVAVVRIISRFVYPIMFFLKDDFETNHIQDMSKLQQVDETLDVFQKDLQSLIFCKSAFEENAYGAYESGSFVNKHKNLTIFSETAFNITKIFKQ